MRLVDGTRAEVKVLSVLVNHSRAVLAAVVAMAEDVEAAVTVTSKAIAKWASPKPRPSQPTCCTLPALSRAPENPPRMFTRLE